MCRWVWVCVCVYLPQCQLSHLAGCGNDPKVEPFQSLPPQDEPGHRGEGAPAARAAGAAPRHRLLQPPPQNLRASGRVSEHKRVCACVCACVSVSESVS